MILVFAVNFLSALAFAWRTWCESLPLWRIWVGFLTIPLSFWIISHSWWMALAILHLPLGISPLLSWWQQRCEQQEIHAQLRELIDGVILAMRSGRSFRTALQESAREIGGPLGHYLSPWCRQFAGHERAPTSPLWWAEIATELLGIDQQVHQSLVRLQSWRARLKLEDNFRRRAGQVALQVRLQALVISGLYFALLVFTWTRNNWREHLALITVSLLLFFCGLSLIFILGRRVKWSF